jgi:hypothetical protein
MAAVSVTWGHGAGVNRYFADESLPGREAAALKAFARRDPRTWAPLVVNAVVLAIVLAWLWTQTPARHDPHVAADTAMLSVGAFGVLCAASYLWWELSLTSRVRRIVGRQSRVGALLTSSFGPRAVRVTTPDISYEIPYTSIREVARFGDVLVIKPNSHLVMALPMELVTRRDYELLMAKVHDRPGRLASTR